MTIGKGKRPRDINQLGKWIVDVATGQTSAPDPLEGKSPAAVKRGRAGGLKGGKNRAVKLTPKQRKEIARNAARARWAERKPGSEAER